MLDYTSLWAFVQTHRDRIQLILIGALLFTGGWQLGRVMSPYYESQPIIFSDRQCAESGGSNEALLELEDAGVAQGSDVAGSVDVSNAQGSFVASINSDLFHHVSCSSASRIKPENQLWFATAAEAVSAGYEASKCTQEAGY